MLGLTGENHVSSLTFISLKWIQVLKDASKKQYLLGPGPSNCANDEESDQEMNGGGQFGELREDEVRGQHCGEYGSKEYGCKSLTQFCHEYLPCTPAYHAYFGRELQVCLRPTI